MKSNFGRSSESKDESLKYEQRAHDGKRVKGFSSKPKGSELIQIVKEIVKRDYILAVEEKGEEAVLLILNEMLTPKYQKKFIPQSKEVITAVKRCVSAFILKMSESRVGEILNIGEIQGKSDEQLQQDLAKLESIKKSMGLKAKTGVDELISTYKGETERRENEKLAVERAEKERIAAEERKRIEAELEIVRKKEEERIAINRKREEEQMATMKAKAGEVTYYETVQKFTNNFGFLAEDQMQYYARMGGGNPVKFNSLDQYSRYTDLREKLTRRIRAMGLSEKQAIELVLNDKNVRIIK